MSKMLGVVPRTRLEQQELQHQEHQLNSNNPLSLSRRELLAGLAASCAGLLAPQAFSGSEPSYVRRRSAEQLSKPIAGKLLSSEQMRLLQTLVDIIIPETDTPGAAASDTHGFIDDQLKHCESPETAKKFVKQLDACHQVIQQHWKHPIWALPTDKKNTVMRALANAEQPFANGFSDFFAQLKSLTVYGYYTSEAGATKELVYDPIPGGYDGNYTLEANKGRAFSIFHI